MTFVPYAKQSFLGKSLPQANASLAGVPMRLNPTSVQLDYTVKTSETPTLGGMVIQIFGIEMSDLIVTGSFGKGGYQEQLVFLNRMLALASMQSNQALVTPSPSKPVRFVYPNRNFDFQVYLKDYDSASGMAIDYENKNIAPDWRLTLFVDTDNLGGGLSKVAADAYIQRLSNGLGYGGVNPYNGQLTVADVASFLAANNYANDPSGYLNAAFGGAAQQPQQSSSSGSSGGSGSDATGGDNVQKTYNYYVGKGLKDFQAAGICGNYMQESGATIDPGSVQPGGPGRGIAQWGVDGRWNGVIALAKTQNVEPTTLGVQLDFSWQELTGNPDYGLAALQATTNVTDAVTVYCTRYEIAGQPDMQTRINYAQSVLTKYGTATKS